ncbi:MAG: hypothetical protein J6U54_07240 [Clostridiales bacterium]|nr:hypothetical protein [Clostridiales bacterium]
MRRRHRRRKYTIEQAAEKRAIAKLDDHDTALDENDTELIKTQLEIRAERRNSRGNNIGNLVLGIGKTAAGIGMGVACLNFEKTGNLTSNISRNMFSGFTKVFHNHR